MAVGTFVEVHANIRRHVLRCLVATIWACNIGFGNHGHHLQSFRLSSLIAGRIYGLFDFREGRFFVVILHGGISFCIGNRHFTHAFYFADFLFYVLFAAATGHAFNGDVSDFLGRCHRLLSRWCLLGSEARNAWIGQ